MNWRSSEARLKDHLGSTLKPKWGGVKHLHIPNRICQASTPETPSSDPCAQNWPRGIPLSIPPSPQIWQQGGHTVTGARIPLALYFPRTCRDFFSVKEKWGWKPYTAPHFSPSCIRFAELTYSNSLLHIFMHIHTCYFDGCCGDIITYSWPSSKHRAAFW